MTETFDIAGYCRISVDEELDRDNVSIENQKAIIRDFVNRRFPGSSLTFYEDRDRSGYTFEQREGYQAMRKGLIRHQYDILVVKDFSRFSRRNSRGLVELEDLRDAGVRIISVGDNIDFPNDDDWLKIQFQFLINEMPVTDTSRKVRNVIKRRQADGEWLCAAPYGYTVNKRKEFEVVPTEADIVRRVWDKFAFISTVATSTSYTDKTYGGVLGDPADRADLDSLLAEFQTVAAAKGIVLSEGIAGKVIAQMERIPADTTTSMQRDFRTGRTTELESLTGYVVREGRRLGVPTPTYDRMYESLRGR
mgnify:CR=1 FL=1